VEYQPPKKGFWDWLLGDDLPRVVPQVPVVLRKRQTEEELQP
jgi:hypothetical protein